MFLAPFLKWVILDYIAHGSFILVFTVASGGRVCWASEMRLGIGYVFFWLRAYVFTEGISNAGMRDSFGTMHPTGEKRACCESSV